MNQEALRTALKLADDSSVYDTVASLRCKLESISHLLFFALAGEEIEADKLAGTHKP